MRSRCPTAWETVHGHIESGEEPEDAALREVREESGLEASRLYNVTVQPFYLHRSHTVQLAVVFAMGLIGDGTPWPDSQGHADRPPTLPSPTRGEGLMILRDAPSDAREEKSPLPPSWGRVRVGGQSRHDTARTRSAPRTRTPVFLTALISPDDPPKKVVIPFDFESKFDDGEYGRTVGDLIWAKLHGQGGFVIPESMRIDVNSMVVLDDQVSGFERAVNEQRQAKAIRRIQSDALIHTPRDDVRCD